MLHSRSLLLGPVGQFGCPGNTSGSLATFDDVRREKTTPVRPRIRRDSDGRSAGVDPHVDVGQTFRVTLDSKSVLISEQRLSQYAGLYWNKDDEHAIRIVLKDGKLFLSQSEEERLELTPLSENRFQLIVFPIAFTFDQATPSTPLRMSIQSPGEEKPDVFERVTEFRPTPDQLSGYAGFYVSEEIEPIYRIVEENGGLVLKRLKSKPQKLQPTLEDYFQGRDGDIHFQRDRADKIMGFELNSGRIKHFRFRKTTDAKPSTNR